MGPERTIAERLADKRRELHDARQDLAKYKKAEVAAHEATRYGGTDERVVHQDALNLYRETRLRVAGLEGEVKGLESKAEETPAHA